MPATPQLPTILLVPGAFLPASCFDILLPYLQKPGYPTVVTTLPSLNPADPTSTTCAADTAWFRENFIVPLVEHDGKDVLLFVHSYGGVAAGAAATGFSKAARLAQGKPGGVVGLVYLAANIVKAGESLLQALDGALPPFVKADTPRPGVAVIDPPVPILYADVERAQAAALGAALLPHSMAALATPAGAPAWAEPAFAGRRAYLRCTEDACLPLALQTAWLQGSGVAWDVRDVAASHGAFVSRAEDVARLVVEFATAWAERS